MTTLNVQAVITAVDRLTGPLAAMGARVQGLQNRFSSAAASAGSFGMAAGMAAGGLIYALTAGQKELDAALRNFQVVGNATDKQRLQMRGMANDLGTHLGMPQLELIQGATEMLQAGLGVDDLFAKGKDGTTLLQSMGEAAKVAGQPIAEMATDLVTLARSFNMPWGNPEDRAKAMKDLMGLAIVAPRLSPDTPVEHVRALKEFGPIASQLGMSPQEASAIQSVLSASGFKGQLGGMGMKSILQRMLNPTTAAQAQMSLSGFNYGAAFNNNLGTLNPEELIKSLETQGLDAGAARQTITQGIANAAAQGSKLDLLQFKAKFSKEVAKALGVTKSDAWGSRIIKTAIDDSIAATGTGINTRQWIKEMAKLPVAALKDVAGLHHASKAAVLSFKDTLSAFDRAYDAIEQQKGSAVSDGFKTKAEGWAYSLDRMGASWEAFRNKMWDAGGAGQWTGAVQKISGALESLGSMSPENLERLSSGLNRLAMGLAGLAAGAGGIWALSRLGALLTGGPIGKLLLGGGLLGIAGGLDPSGGLDQSVQGLVSSLGQLAETFAKLSGIQLEGGALLSGLGAIQKLVDTITAGLNSIDKALKGDPQSTLGPGDGSFLGMRLAEKGLAPSVRDASRSFGDADANAAGKGSTSFWDMFKAGMMPGSGPSAALGQAGQLQQAPQQPIGPITAKLEGSGTVTVNVKVEGPGQVTGVSASDDGKNISLKTGGGMGDTNK
jgi:TP901 family phage tail tape measure protein